MKNNFYLLQHGELIKKDNSIEFISKDNQKTNIPLLQVDAIYTFATVSISSECLKLLSNNGIVVHYFDYYENYIGTFYPKIIKTLNGDLLVKQVHTFCDIDKRLEVSKETIKASFKNMHRLIGYYSKRKSVNCDDFELHYVASMEKIVKANSINDIMILEANLHKIYYNYWNKFLNFDYGFHKREKKDAKDIINALLSFLNSLLYSLIVSEIYKTGLNPTISYLHEPSQSRFSLSFDIAEIFRPILVERLIFNLLNKNIIQDNDFINYRFTESAIKKILYHWDNKINETIYHRKLKRNISYRYLIREELYKLVRYVKGECAYKGFVMWW
ncbi:MAG: type I-B CRISPR-associated endonuclease Cas1 [Clostridia bacterium]|nr:type I-B CRISPR-associated endonuclease Cas1 [Clostridia bacterium]